MNTKPAPRLAYWKAAPSVFQAMMALEKVAGSSGLEKPLYELVKLRVSQINGCAFCVHMHASDARQQGESPDRLDLVAVWAEAHCYSPRERAALRWAELLTRLPSGHVSDEDFSAVRAEFSEEETAQLTLVIATINAWNRFGVGFNLPPGFSA